MSKPRILFVDDEPNVLSGLRRMLRGKRAEWEMEFCEGGAQALEALADGGATLIVTDMRMPEISGAALLREVGEKYPETIRFVLSGQSDEEAGIRASGVTHQFLSKPADKDVLINSIERSLTLREELRSPELIRVTTGLKALPVIPKIYLALRQQLLADPYDLDRIKEIVESDPALAAKLLQISNSSFFGPYKQISNIKGAISFLGTDTIKALALTCGVIEQMQSADQFGRELSEQLITHSAISARLARKMGQDLGLSEADCDDAYTGGLLHDIGLLVLIENYPEFYKTNCVGDEAPEWDLKQLEKETFSVSHCEVGGYLLGNWGLPDSIVESTISHHLSPLEIEKPIGVPDLVRLANKIVEVAERKGTLEGVLPFCDPMLARHADGWLAFAAG